MLFSGNVPKLQCSEFPKFDKSKMQSIYSYRDGINSKKIWKLARNQFIINVEFDKDVIDA